MPSKRLVLFVNIFLEICINYIDIFYSPILDLPFRIVLCTKDDFFFFGFGDYGNIREIMRCLGIHRNW